MTVAIGPVTVLTVITADGGAKYCVQLLYRCHRQRLLVRALTCLMDVQNA